MLASEPIDVASATNYRVSVVASLAAGSTALVALASAPFVAEIPGAAISIAAFFGVPCLLRRAAPSRSTLLSPLNWGHLYFLLQLVLVPLVMAWLGVRKGVLPFIPSTEAIFRAQLVQSATYVLFCLGAAACSRRSPERRGSGDERPVRDWRVALVWELIGLAGLLASFGSVSGLIEYFRNPALALIAQSDGATSVGGAIGIFLRPFLLWAPVLGWSTWADRRAKVAPLAERAGVALAVVSAIVFGGATFNFNRAAMVLPLVAFAAAWSRTVRPLRLTWLLLAGVVTAGASLAIGTYRSSGLAIADALNDPTIQLALADRVDVAAQIQVYGQGPQFLAFLLEANDFSERRYWGQTLLSSALYPLPVVGKPFRDGSGVTIYNQLIYGDRSIVDQIIPFAGELYLNLHLIGVVVGYLLLGAGVVVVEHRFRTASHGFARFGQMYLGMWLCFLILGSIAAVSQAFIYFFLPLYVESMARNAGRLSAAFRQFSFRGSRNRAGRH